MVFGCGGDRDKSKRPKMAEACGDMPISASSLLIIPGRKIRCKSAGKSSKDLLSRGIYEVELDRRAAIQRAIEMATPEDTILIAGKGHETYQIFAHQTIEFDDARWLLKFALNFSKRGRDVTCKLNSSVFAGVPFHDYVWSVLDGA